MTTNALTEIDGLRRSRQFMSAYHRARALFDADSTSSLDRFLSARCIGRIYFEFGRHESAERWLKEAELETDGVDLTDRRSLTALRIWAEYRKRMPRNWITRRKANTDLSDPILDDESRLWLYRMTDWRTAPRSTRGESADLILAGCHQFRSHCLADPQDRSRPSNARKYFENAYATGLFEGTNGQRYDSFLSMSSTSVQFQYHWAAFLFETGDLASASTEFEKLFAMREGNGHVTARLASAQLARALMKPGPQRRRTIKEAYDTIEQFYFRPYDEPSIGDGNNQRVVFDAELHYLRRQEADSYSVFDPSKANSILEKADRELGDADVSYGRPRYLTTMGVDRARLEACVGELIESTGLTPLAPALRIPVQPWESGPNHGTITEVDPTARLGPDAVEQLSAQVFEVLGAVALDLDPADNWGREDRARALIAIVDVIRSLGADSLALAWYKAIARHVKTSGLAVGRLVSLLNSLGHHDEAVAVGQDALANPCAIPFEHRAFVDVELGRAQLELGNYDAASQHFERVANSRWRQLAIDGYTGRIDVARRSRRIREARVRVEEARVHFAECDAALLAEIDIAEGWVEIQLGSPRSGFRLLRRALKSAPYSVGAWIGLVRSLRMLGKHLQALTVTAHLSGEPDGGELPWLDPDHPNRPGVGYIPRLSLRHGGRLRNERGWTLLDLDRLEDAAQEFTAALHRSPNLSPCYRGMVLSSAHTPQSVKDGFAAACALLTKSSRHQPDVLKEIHFETGRALASFGDEQASDHFDEVLRMTNEASIPQSLKRRYGFAIADVYLSASNIPLASSHLKEALRARSASDNVQDDRPLIFRAKLAMARGAPKEGLREIAAHVEDGREVSEALRIAHFVAAFECRDFAEAEKLADSVGTLPPLGSDEAPDPPGPCHVPDSEIRSLLKAWVCLAQSELPAVVSPEERVVQARELIESTDMSSLDELHLCAILEARGAVINKGSLEAANQYIDLALQRRPDDPSLLRDKAAIQRSLGQLRTASKLLGTAERKSPHDARIHLLTGAVRFALGDTTGAVESFRSAAALDPNDYVHHRAIALALAELGDLDEAIRVATHGIEVVDTGREYRLEVLRARLVAQKAQEQPARQRAVHLDRVAKRLEATQKQVSNPAERAEVLSRRAYIAALQGNYQRARRFLRDARKQDSSNPEIGHLSDQIPTGLGFVPSWGIVSVLAVQIFSIVLLGLMIWRYVQTDSDSNATGPTQIIALLALLAGLPFLAPLIQRIRSFRVFQTTIELSETGPVSETVHVDLDISASDLLRISGFSNHRPTVPFDDVEPRTFDYD